MSLLNPCRLCPRQCGVDRTKGRLGFCRIGDRALVSRVALHFWEEPYLVGRQGSGTIFFDGCSLKCLYCQNTSISQAEAFSGRALSVRELASCCLYLKSLGAANINLVTPTHVSPMARHGVKLAKALGLGLPVVYNTSSYDGLEELKRWRGLADIYLADLKYLSSEKAGEYSKAPDYPKYALLAIKEMVDQTGPCCFNEEGMLVSGTVVRHLVLPKGFEEAKRVLDLLRESFGKSILISLMNQYTVMPAVSDHPVLGRRLSPYMYDRLIDHVLATGMDNVYIQEGKTSDASFIPPFTHEGVEEGRSFWPGAQKYRLTD